MNLPGLESASLRSIEAQLFSRSLRDYIPEAFKAAFPAQRYVHGWHIDAIAEHLEAVSSRQIKRLIISIAPRSMKSLSASVFFPTWEWTHNPSTRFIYGAYKMDLSMRDAVGSRRLMDTVWYRERWGCNCEEGRHEPACTSFRFTSDQNVKTLYENDRGGRRLTASVEAGTTGEGGDVLVLDDPLDIQSAHSASARASAIAYVAETWLGRANDPKTSAFVVIAQRTHEEDVSGYLLGEGGWDHLCIPTEFEPPGCSTSIGWKDPRTTAGELMWPDRFGPEELKDIKTRPYAFAAQHQQRPAPAAGGIIKREWIRLWSPRGVTLPPVRDRHGNEYIAQPLPDEFDNELQSWDLSFKGEAETIRKGRDPDFVSGGAWGRSGPDCYLLDRICARMGIVEAVAAIRAMHEMRQGPILIEDKANGPAAMAILRRDIPGIIPVTPKGSKVQRVMTAANTQGDKDARAIAMVDLFHAGNVFLPHPAIMPAIWDYIENIVVFPNGAYDDDVDMTSQALMHLQGKAWQQADAAQREAARNGGMPPPLNTLDVLRQERAKALAAEKKPRVKVNPWRRVK